MYPQLQTSLLHPLDLTKDRRHFGQVRLMARVADDSRAVRREVASVSKQVCGSIQGARQRVQLVERQDGLRQLKRWVWRDL